MYPADLVKPMREELTAVGFEELQNVEAVDQAIKKKAQPVVAICLYCAAANARPGARMSLDNAKKPDHLVTVFAVDKEATDKGDTMYHSHQVLHRWHYLKMVNYTYVRCHHIEGNQLI